MRQAQSYLQVPNISFLTAAPASAFECVWQDGKPACINCAGAPLLLVFCAKLWPHWLLLEFPAQQLLSASHLRLFCSFPVLQIHKSSGRPGHAAGVEMTVFWAKLKKWKPPKMIRNARRRSRHCSARRPSKCRAATHFKIAAARLGAVPLPAAGGRLDH